MIQSLEGMDLADRLREMSSRIRQRIDNVKTEEATKTVLVMPFINHVLGYNVFDPAEVVPEFINGDPIMLFECKHYGVDLGKEPASQLYRYFSVAKARFGVLTDGVIYRFYSDIDEQNKMDARPFLEINMLDVDGIDVDELKRFTKSSFDLDQILSTAKDLKYTREVLRLLTAEWDRSVRSVRPPLCRAGLRGREDQGRDRAVHASDEEGAPPVRGETHQRQAEIRTGEHRPRRACGADRDARRRDRGNKRCRHGDRHDRGGMAGVLRRDRDSQRRGVTQQSRHPRRQEPVRDPARQHEPTAHLSAVLQQGAEEDRLVERGEGGRPGGDRVDQRHLQSRRPNQGHGPAVRGGTERDSDGIAAWSGHEAQRTCTGPPAGRADRRSG